MYKPQKFLVVFSITRRERERKKEGEREIGEKENVLRLMDEKIYN